MAAVALLFFLGPTEVLLPIRIDGDLGASAGSFGLVLAAGGVGATLGTFVLGHIGMPKREISVLYWVWGLAGFALCGYALGQTVWQLVLFSFAFGLLSGAGNPIWSTLMQVRVPVGLRGRVASLDWLVSVGLTPVSFALTGPAAAAFGAGRGPARRRPGRRRADGGDALRGPGPAGRGRRHRARRAAAERPEPSRDDMVREDQSRPSTPGQPFSSVPRSSANVG